jgi:hypothetical protein
MRNFYILIFLASILLTASCTQGGSGSGNSGCSNPVAIEIAPGRRYTVNGVSATAGPNGATVTGCAPVLQ